MTVEIGDKFCVIVKHVPDVRNGLEPELTSNYIGLKVYNFPDLVSESYDV